jgi:hypothetical protein
MQHSSSENQIMYSIIDRQSYREDDTYKIWVEINSDRNTLEIDCLIPAHRRIAFGLSGRGKRDLIHRKYYQGGSHVAIPLGSLQADHFTFEASDESGKTVVIYQIVRSLD